MTATPPPDTDERRTRPFADTLRDFDRGRVHTELSEQLQTLVEAVMDVGKAGTLALTVKVTPTKAEDTVEVTAVVAAKPPKATRASIFYVSDDHNLTRDNPRQPFLPLAGVPGDGDQPARSAR